MGATEEQMQLLSDAHVTHVSYILILFSMAFLLYLFVNVLLHLYFVYTFPQGDPRADSESDRRPGILKRHSSGAGLINDTNGHPRPLRAPRMPWHRGTDSQQIRDAETFELQGLIEDDEELVLESKEGGIQSNGHAH